MERSEKRDGRRKRPQVHIFQTAIVLLIALALSFMPVAQVAPAASASAPEPSGEKIAGAPEWDAGDDGSQPAPAGEVGESAIAILRATHPAPARGLVGLQAFGDGATILGAKPLIFDPTPASPDSGDEVIIGTITVTQGPLTDKVEISVIYEITEKPAQYDLVSIKTTLGGDERSQTFAEEKDSATETFALNLPLNTGPLSITACATLKMSKNVEAVNYSLPTVGTVKVDSGGNVVQPASYFDTIVTPGWIPDSTDIENDFVTFDPDPAWPTGTAIRVVASYGADVTGLVTPPTTSPATTSAAYFVRNLDGGAYSFFSTYADAVAGVAAPRDITAPIPTNGEIIIAGENDALPFLGQIPDYTGLGLTAVDTSKTPDYTGLGLTAIDTSQAPLADGLVPASTKTALTTSTGPTVTATDTTNDTVDLASAVTWVSGDRVQVSGASGGGLNAGTTYYVRVVDSDTVSFHTSWAGAQNNTSRVNVTAAIDTTRTGDPVAPDDETVTIAPDPGWATGTAVRVSATGGGLSVGTTYYVHSLGSGVYSFFDTAANATNTDADSNPLNGRKDLTAAITATVFANLTTVSFANPHEWATGTMVRVTATGGGLSAGTTYYARAIDVDRISFHTTLANAQGNISPVVFTAPIVATVFNAESVTFTAPHDLADGTAVFVSATGAGLSVNTTYYVHTVDADTVRFYTSRANALAAGTSGLATITSPTFGASVYNAEQLKFAAAHGWATGTAARVTAAGGGLAINTTYYVNALDANTITLYDTLANAQAGTATGLKVFTGPITANVFNAESVTFTAPHGLANGTAVFVSADGGGLSDNTTYYVRDMGGNAVSFYSSRAYALAGGANGRSTITSPTIAALTYNAETLFFAQPHGWITGTVVRVAASVGGLSLSTNYYVRVVSPNTITLYDTLANAQAGSATGLKVFTAPITALVTPMFNGWCVDNDRLITPGGEYIANILSSYEAGSFPDSTTHPKSSYGTEAGLSPVNTSATPSGTDTTLARVTFATTTALGWADNQAVRVTADGGGLLAGVTYYVDVVSAGATSTVVTFHTATPVAAGNRVGLTAAVAATVYRAQTLDFATNTGWPTGTRVMLDVDDGGLSDSTGYYARAVDGNTISFHPTRDDAIANANIITLSDPIETSTIIYVPENLVEFPENLDVMNWVLNQGFEAQLAAGKAPTATAWNTNLRVPTTNYDNAGFLPYSTDITAETVTFITDPEWATATLVRVTATGGLTAGTNYYVRNLGGGVYSFYNSAVNAAGVGTSGRLNLTAAITATVYAFAPSLGSTEDTVTFNDGHGFVMGSIVNVTADGGGLDASTKYFLYNVAGDTFSIHTAAAWTAANKVDLTAAVAPRGIYPWLDDTVTVPAYGWATGMGVQVSADAGGLLAGVDYYIRAIDSTTLAFYATAADATNNVNRIDLTGDIQPETVRPYYTAGDIERAVWELIENSPNTSVGNLERVLAILAEADAAVGIDNPAVTYVPGCNETLSIFLQPFEVDQASNQQITIAQITTAQVPNYCYQAQSATCQTFVIPLGSISGMKFNDTNGNGTKDAGDLGLAGWTIFVDYDGNKKLGANEPSAMTGPDGAYSIIGVLYGTWTVREVGQADWVATVPTGDASITVDAENLTFPGLDFGNFQLFNICGVKVWDVDRDGAAGGINDAGDLRLAGVRIYWDANGNDAWDTGELNTSTGPDGAWCLNDLVPAANGYNIKEDASTLPGDPSEWESSGAPATIPAISGADVSNADFYNYKFPPREYMTYSQGGYAGKGAPGMYLLTHFTLGFSTGLVVPRSPAGADGDVSLTSALQVQAFLKAKTSTVLETQFVALSLSVGFSANIASFDLASSPLGDLELCNLTNAQAPANGLTITEFLAQVYQRLDGAAGYTLGIADGDLVNILGNLNLGFDAGAVAPWAELHLQ